MAGSQKSRKGKRSPGPVGREGRRPTIGLFVDRVDRPYEARKWWGAVDAARAHDANLICFPAGSWYDHDDPAANFIDLTDSGGDHPGRSHLSNVLFDVAGPETLDGLILCASTWGVLVREDYGEKRRAFVDRYRPLPLVCAEVAFDGLPGVFADDGQGACDALIHLIEVHGRRRIAFVWGMRHHPWIQERFRVYVETLAQHGLPFDPDLVFPPHWECPSYDAWPLSPDRLPLPVPFDAVLACYDTVAIEVSAALQARGIHVPGDVAVVSFDDDVEGRAAIPALTTVQTSCYEIGVKAVETALALIEGGRVPDRTVLPMPLIVRESCGCPSAPALDAGVDGVAPAGGSPADSLSARRERILAAVREAAGERARGIDPGWADQLLDGFRASLEGTAPRAFAENLGAILGQASGARGDLASWQGILPRASLRPDEMAGASDHVAAWQRVLSALRSQVLPCLAGDVDALIKADALWEQARVLTGEMTLRAEMRRRLLSVRQADLLHEIGATLASTLEIEGLADVLARELPRLGIPSCHLALYEDPGSPAAWSRLILSYGEEGRAALPPEGVRFPTCQLLPGGLLSRDRRYSLIVKPLYFQDDQIGLATFEVGPREGAVYEALRAQISSAFQGALLLRHNVELYDESLRARAAAEKADGIKTRLLANVSHELRTPLNVILGCVQVAQDSLARDPKGAQDVLGDLQHVRHSAEHLLRVTNDLLDLSRAEIDELDLHLEMVDTRPFLEDVFDSIAEGAASPGVTWRLDLPDRLPALRADPVRLRQVLLNLLSNASKFTEEGEIVLGAEIALPHLHVWVRDTGIGVPVDSQERIFEPFGAVARAGRRPGGIGLGLSIARHLVTLHRGSLTLESRPGQGSTFRVTLPLPSLDDRPALVPASAQPVLLLVSAREEPAAEIAEFSRRQGLEVRRLDVGGDVGAVLEGVRPAALAWDLATAGDAAWEVVEQLRGHSYFCQVPFVLYGGEGDREAEAAGLTDFVIKPASGDALLQAIGGLHPGEGARPILVVDDDAGARELYRGLVERDLPDYPVRTAANGADAMAFMASEVPGLVVLDLTMPEMDGFEVLDRMRADERTRHVPVLILSGRMLTFDDVKRLERHARVTVQSKDVLTEDETAASLHRALFGSDVLPPHAGAVVKRGVAYFHQNYDRPLSRREVAEAVGVSERYFSRLFRQELGIAPWEYLNRYRVARARDLLRRTNDSIIAISVQVGFNSPTHFGRVFRGATGLSPSAYREDPGRETKS